MTVLYGIGNCDTVRKARKWLSARQIDYQFHDVRKDGLTAKQLKAWEQAVGWETLLNKRGTSWRKLDETSKASVNKTSAMQLMLQEPALIKRPVLQHQGNFTVGFSEATYSSIFK